MHSTRGTLRQVLSAFIASIGVFSLGGVLSWTSSSLYKIQAEGSIGNISVQQFAQLSSTATLGAMFASPLAGVSVDYLGRKNTMLMMAPVFTIGWLILGFANNLTVLHLGRFITGVAGGGFGVSTPIYISEVAEDKIRGFLASFFQLMLVSGILFADVVGTYASGENLAFISSAFTIALCILLWPLKESPRALLCQGKFLAARESLYYFRGTPVLSSLDTMKVPPVEQELTEIGDSIRRSSCFSWKEIFRARRPLLLCLSLVIFKSPVTIFYAFNIFRSAGTNIDYNLSLCIVAVVQVLATLVSSLLVDKCGRRVLLILSEAVMAISLFALGTFFHLQKSEHGLQLINDLSLHWLPLVSLAFFIISFSIGAGPLSWTVQAEIIPPNIKGICSSIATTFVWFLAFLLTNTYGLLVDSIGSDWAFYFFAFICLVGTVVIIIFLPETKGLSLDAIQELFAK